MSCTHERIKSVNCEIFCMTCGAKLPIDYLVGKERIAAQNEPVEAVEPAKQPKAKKSTKKRGEK